METKICRVCFEDDDAKLISPCECNGTQKYIHKECFDKWLLISRNDTTCPTCHYEYNKKSNLICDIICVIFNISFCCFLIIGHLVGIIDVDGNKFLYVIFVVYFFLLACIITLSC